MFRITCRLYNCTWTRFNHIQNPSAVSIRQGRGNRGGGGAVGAICPPNLEAAGAPPPNFGEDGQCKRLLFLGNHVNLGPSPKIMGKSGEFLVLGRGYLGPRETFASPPPPNFKEVPAPLRLDLQPGRRAGRLCSLAQYFEPK